MKKLDAKTPEADEGWIVQVYGSNRRLLCVLEPSHGWIFLAGCVVGLLVAILLFNLSRYVPATDPAGSTNSTESTTDSNAPTQDPNLQVD